MTNETATAPTPDNEQEPQAVLVCEEIGKIPTGSIVYEDGLALMFGKNCRETIKRAVERGELPPPVKLMGRNCWTAGRIICYIEQRLEAEERRHVRLRG